MSEPLQNAKRMVAMMRRRMAPEAIVRHVTIAGNQYLKSYYRTLGDGWKNSLGAKSYYWASVVKSANYRVSGTHGEFGIYRVGVNLLYYGGTVTPGKGIANPGGGKTQRLARPARAESYGMAPKDFSGLKIKWVMNPETGYPQMALVSDEGGAESGNKRVSLKGTKIATRGKRKGQTVKTSTLDTGGTVYFWLIKSATIKPHQTAHPTKEAVFGALRAARDEYVAGVKREAMSMRGGA